VKNEWYAYLFKVTVFLGWYVELMVFYPCAFVTKNEKLIKKASMLKILLNETKTKQSV